ncbi:MAG: hypothetical protein KIS92_18300, partial [Planctomycetota bacterium]|nr:hypothetical protein [Planctomycetota bacterium]
PVAPAVPVAPAPPAGAADWTDLLRGIDAERDAVAGRWHNDREGLSCEVPPVWNSSVIELRPPPAEEYDFRAEFTVNRHPRDGWGRGEVCLIFNAEGKHARFALWSLDFYHIGFVWDRRHFVVMNATASNNVTMARQPAQLEQLRTYTAHIEVRKDLVKGYLDGKLITEWRPNDFTENDMASFVLRDRQKLGVGAYQSQVRFTKLDVRPATR